MSRTTKTSPQGSMRAVAQCEKMITALVLRECATERAHLTVITENAVQEERSGDCEDKGYCDVKIIPYR